MGQENIKRDRDSSLEKENEQEDSWRQRDRYINKMQKERSSTVPF